MIFDEKMLWEGCSGVNVDIKVKIEAKKVSSYKKPAINWDRAYMKLKDNKKLLEILNNSFFSKM